MRANAIFFSTSLVLVAAGCHGATPPPAKAPAQTKPVPPGSVRPKFAGTIARTSSQSAPRFIPASQAAPSTTPIFGAPTPAPSFPATHTSKVTSLHFSSDGSRLQSAADDAWLLESDVKTNRTIAGVELHYDADGPFFTIVDEGRLVTGWCMEGIVHGYDAATGQGLWVREHYTGVTYSPDGKLFSARATNVNGIGVFDVETFALLQTVPVDAGRVFFSQDAKTLAGVRGSVTFYDRSNRELAKTADDGMSAGVFSPDGRTFAAWGDNSVILYDVASGKPVRKITTQASVTESRFAPDGRSLAVELDDGNGTAPVVVLDPATGTSLWECRPSGAAFTAIAFSPDGSLLATGDANGRVVLWTNGRSN